MTREVVLSCNLSFYTTKASGLMTTGSAKSAARFDADQTAARRI